MRSTALAVLGHLGDRDLAARALGAPLVDDDVARDREQPRAHRGRRAVEHGAVPPGPQQRLLYDVLGARPVVADQTKAEAPQRSGVLVVQLSHERRLVAGHLASSG